MQTKIPFTALKISVVTVLFLLGGCTSTQQWLENQPKSFREGYDAGCKNGKARVENSYLPKTNDTERYRTDEEYKKGWDEGYEDCKLDKETDIMMQRDRMIR